MKELKYFLIAILVSASLGVAGGYYLKDRVQIKARGIDQPAIKAVFSPKGGCTSSIVEIIDSARESILLQAYSFTSDPIEHALIEAKKRGVTVRVVLDRSQYEAKGAAALPLFEAGIEVRMDAKHAIAHNKIIIVDDEILITGSFNFTRQAETSNAENLLIIRNPELALAYAQNWKTHYEHSDPYNGETVRPRKQ